MSTNIYYYPLFNKLTHIIDWTSIENWPVNTDAAREALPSMHKTHKVIPFPAFDMHGNLIHPSSYRSRLIGAVAELDFELTHWAMKKNPPNDTYSADVVALRVIVPPKSVSLTPRKRMVPLKLDPFESPTPNSKKKKSFL